MTLLAPNGNPSNLTPQQWELVRTPEFKAWFGDWEKLAMAKVKDPAMDDVTLENLSKNVSKVVDSNGEPLVCYHGTYRDFTIFDISKVGNIDKGFFSKGFYFTPNSDLAYIYGKNLYACFIDIKNPIRTKSRQDLANDLGLEYDNNTYSEIAREKIISLNYDGVLQEYNLPKAVKALYPFVEIVAYYPEQIKLADGTNTTFDGSNPDIRYNNGGIVDNSNYFDSTRGDFEPISKSDAIEIMNEYVKWRRKKNKPEFIQSSKFGNLRVDYESEKKSAFWRSRSFSFYFISEDNTYIIRISDHWSKSSYPKSNKLNCGFIRSCYWTNFGEERFDFRIPSETYSSYLLGGLCYFRNFQKTTSNPDIRFDNGGNIDTPDEFYGERGVGALIYCTSTNRFLLLHRGIYVQEPNTWGMVSGKVDDDDLNLEYAVSREAEEELDVVLNNFVPTYIFKKGDFTFHNYFAFVEDEFEPRLNWENNEYRWVTLDEFPDNLHFGLKILMEKVDLRTFQPKEEFADGGSVERDVYTGQQIKKVYVSIRIRYETERSSNLNEYKYLIESIDEKPFTELSNGVLEGVLGVSTSSYNLSEWLVNRECLVMMPFNDFVRLNNTEQVQYFDAYYLTKEGLKPFFRLYDRKGTGDKEYYSVLQTIFPKIALELELESMLGNELSTDFYILKSWFDVYVSSKFLNYIANQPRINRPEDLVEYSISYWKSGEAEKDYYYGQMPTKITGEDILPVIIRGIVSAGKIYDTESEWLMLDKKLVIPDNSRLFFVDKGYDNIRDEYEKLIAKYNLRSKYKINYIKQQELNELQSEKFELKSKEFQAIYDKSRSEIDKKILKAYKKAQNDIIENWTNKLQAELSDYFSNLTFRDWDGNQYGTNIFEVPSVSLYYDNLILKFIEFYDAQAETFVNTKDKYVVAMLLESFRDYLRQLINDEGSQQLEAYTDYDKVYKSNILEKLRYLVVYEWDSNAFGNMIKSEVGSDLYRYFKKDEIRLKVGGVV